MTRLAAFADRVLEAGWLTTVAVVPLYFNIFSGRTFEPDKITVLSAIVALMALAQLVKWEEGRGDRLQLAATAAVEGLREAVSVRDRRLIVAALSVLATWLIATSVSITPAISFWGSYQRLQGAYSMLSYVVLFLLIAANLRTRPQLERLFTVILLVSLPISWYAIAQHARLDPLSWGSDTTTRVTSSMGNAIFFAAYLIMVVPITLLRVLASVDRLRQRGKVERGDIYDGVGRALVLALALIAGLVSLSVFLSVTPASPNVWWVSLPLIGLIVALAILFHDPHPTYSMTLAGLAGYLTLLVTQLAALFLSGSRGPGIGIIAALIAFAAAFAFRRGWQRRSLAIAIVAGAVIAIFLVLFNLPNSPLASLRDVPYLGRLGTLAETRVDTVKVRVLIWQGTLELLATRPPIGLTDGDPLGAARLLLGYGPEAMYTAFHKVYPPALAHYEARNASPDRNHNDLLDNLVHLGLLGLGAYLFLLVTAFRLLWRRFSQASERSAQLTLAAILAALLAHVVESLSGIVVAATREYFWVYLGILASGVAWREQAGPATISEAIPAATGGDHRRWPVRGVGAIVAALFVVLVMFASLALRGVPEVQDVTLAMILGFAGLVIIPVAVFAVPEASIRPMPFCRISRVPIYALAGLAAGTAVLVNLNFAAADVYFKRGLLSAQSGQFDDSVRQYLEALRLAPNQDRYHLYLGQTYLEAAKVSKRLNIAGGDQLFDAARKSLDRALELDPLNPDHHVNLARLYRVWGEPDDRAMLGQAATFYRQAITLRPRAAHLYDEWAVLDVARGDLEGAQDRILRALGIDDEFDASYVLLGDIHMLSGRPEQALAAHRSALSINAGALSDEQFERRVASYERLTMLGQLGEAYQTALKVMPKSAAGYAGFGYVLAKQDNFTAARSAFDTSVRLAESDWAVLRYVSLLYQSLGMVPEAITTASAALRYAPASQAPSLRALIAEFGKESSRQRE